MGTNKREIFERERLKKIIELRKNGFSLNYIARQARISRWRLTKLIEKLKLADSKHYFIFGKKPKIKGLK